MYVWITFLDIKYLFGASKIYEFQLWSISLICKKDIEIVLSSIWWIPLPMKLRIFREKIEQYPKTRLIILVY